MKSFVESARPAARDREADKSLLRDGFEQFLEQLTPPELHALAQQRDKTFEALRGSVSAPAAEKLSPRVRNQIAFARGKALALERIKQAYELLDSKTACEVLGISRQALHKKVQQGQVLAYTDGARKFYPAFQFVDNAVMPEVAGLVAVLGIDPRDEAMVNLLLGFLGHEMDWSNPDEPENQRVRFGLLSEPEAVAVMVRDFRNRLEMGR